VADELLQDQAEINVYDPKVSAQRIIDDLEYLQTLKEGNGNGCLKPDDIRKRVIIHTDPYSATSQAHAAMILTEWDEFRTYDWHKVYQQMLKPAFLFDGRNVLNGNTMKDIGFRVYQIGK